jgi:hypothetical protein
MSKRFIDTDIFRKPWFFKLDRECKLFWIYLFTNCDIAGVIDLNVELAKVESRIDNIEELIKKLDKQLVKLSSGKYHLTEFVEFQYGELSEKCKPHLAVIKKLKFYGILKNKGYAKGIQTLKDKDKDKDKDKAINNNTMSNDCNVNKCKNEKKETDLQKVINRYLEIKNSTIFNNISKHVVAEGYKRNVKVANRLLTLSEKNTEKSIERIEFLSEWGKDNNCNWTLETVCKSFTEPDTFNIKRYEYLKNLKKKQQQAKLAQVERDKKDEADRQKIMDEKPVTAEQAEEFKRQMRETAEKAGLKIKRGQK